MSNSFDIGRSMWEISVLVDEVNEGERRMALPEIEELYDTDRLEALDIINRIERRMLSRIPDEQKAAASA